MSEKSFILKYLFVAEFMDGSIKEQTPADVSKLDPSRSEFYDVLHAGKAIKRFSLVGEGNTITVDLVTGLFTINQLLVLLESEKLPLRPEKFDLIFYRQHTHSLNVEYELKTGIPVSSEPAGHSCEYFIGWQCNINGKNYQQKIAVS